MLSMEARTDLHGEHHSPKSNILRELFSTFEFQFRFLGLLSQNLMKFCMVNNLTIVNIFFLHTLHHNIKYSALIKRKTTDKKVGEGSGKEFLREVSKDMYICRGGSRIFSRGGRIFKKMSNILTTFFFFLGRSD